jgi:hypothetical protein
MSVVIIGTNKWKKNIQYWSLWTIKLLFSAFTAGPRKVNDRPLKILLSAFTEAISTDSAGTISLDSTGLKTPLDFSGTILLVFLFYYFF